MVRQLNNAGHCSTQQAHKVLEADSWLHERGWFYGGTSPAQRGDTVAGWSCSGQRPTTGTFPLVPLPCLQSL